MQIGRLARIAVLILGPIIINVLEHRFKDKKTKKDAPVLLAITIMNG
jgi:hypothetical protein